MAGVRGPCPYCSATIQAPPALPPMDQPRAVLVDPPAVDDPPSGASIRPEPRERPRRGPAIAARKSTEDEALRRKPVAARNPAAGRAPSLERWALPVGFFAISGLVVFLLLHFFGGSVPPQAEGDEAAAPAAPEGSRPTPADPRPQAPPAVVGGMPATTPQPVIDDAEGKQAIRQLETFLAAGSLSERLPLLDPPPAEGSADAALLDGPMPGVSGVLSRPPFRHPLEGWNGWPFRVSFRGGEGSTVDYLVLMICRPDEAPRVATEPFLDLVGGRLARFAATPTEDGEPRTFRAIVEPMPRCFEPGIPGAERKFTYKLSSCAGGLELGRAYANLNSRLADQLRSRRSGIHFGARVRATFTIAWNLKEDPEQPYLEMLELKELEWRP